MTECCSPPPPLPWRHTHRHTTAKHSLRSAKTKGPSSRGGVLTNAHIQSSLMVQKQRDMGNAGDGGDRLDPQVGKIPPEEKMRPTPEFSPERSHEQRSLVGYSSWGRKRVRRDWPTQHTGYIHLVTQTPIKVHIEPYHRPRDKRVPSHGTNAQQNDDLEIIH